jgi:hypothetical protein
MYGGRNKKTNAKYATPLKLLIMACVSLLCMIAMVICCSLGRRFYKKYSPAFQEKCLLEFLYFLNHLFCIAILWFKLQHFLILLQRKVILLVGKIYFSQTVMCIS